MPIADRGSIVEAVKAVRPAVVQIVNTRIAYDLFFHPAPQTGAGSGVLFDNRGYLLTNNHVVAGNQQLTVYLPDGRNFQGQVLGSDAMSDIAVVKIQDTSLPTAPLGNSDELEIGEQVVAIGNALGLEGGPTVTAGVVSAKGRVIRSEGKALLYDLIQTDASINPGNSGGPLINLKGEIVGINTAIVPYAQGIGFSISINSAKPIINELLAHGRVIKPWLGVGLVSVTPALATQHDLAADRGVLIVEVEPGGSADRAGLESGDIIVEFNGTAVGNESDLRREITRHKVGETINARVIRGKREGTLPITLQEMPRG